MSTETNIGDFLTIRASLNTNKEAVFDIHKDLRLSYDAINKRANQAAAAIRDIGLQAGDRVGILAYNSHEFLEAFFGLAKIGIVVMPLNWRLTADELAFILKDGGAKAIIFDTDFAGVIGDIKSRGEAGSDLEHYLEIGGQQAEFASEYETVLAGQPNTEPADKASGEDNLFIMYTSGTTGLPKGVVHTHNNMLWAVLTINNTAESSFSDHSLVVLPMFHVGALAPIFTSIYGGHSLVIERSFDPQLTWQIIQQEKITNTLLVPAMLNVMLQVPDLEQYDWTSLRSIMSGAAPLPVAIIEAYAELDIEIHQVYGLTETCGPACLIGPDDATSKIGSTGKAFFHTEVRIVDEGGATVEAGTPGEIVVRGAHIMKEYWNRPEATAETVKDGWLYTGDIAVMDSEGFVTICDRIKDMIISGGENIYPAEVENVLLEHAAVLDAAVIGQQSARWGESPCAVIVCPDGAINKEDLIAHCEQRLARFKVPKDIIVVDEIPRNPSGKILKRVLREQYSEAASG
ncbi:MAG: long-chain-fatty-acid--CoA ligase [Pseudomonadales bacterium]